MATETCNVCCEALNNSTRKAVTCFCDFTACRECTQRYLLDSITDPHCMSCRKAWDREFLDSRLTGKFINQDLKIHREKVLLDIEKSMLPATQVYVEQIKLRNEIDKEVRDIDREIRRLTMERHTLMNQRYNEMGVTRQPRKEFVRACPAPDCKGFLSTQWKCGVCDKWTCPDCHELKGYEKDAEHTCNPDNVATAKLLAKDSQPCPKCGAMCTKVDGCDQVFAMCCKTTFNWRTGKVETGPIHAPDYYRWLQRNGREIPRNPADIPCGGLPRIRDILAVLQNMGLKEHMVEIQEIHRAVIHIEQVEMRVIDVRDHGEADNRDLRIQYMMNEITEEQLKVTLQQREKKRNKQREIHGVLSTVMIASTDIFQRICNAKKKVEIIAAFDEFEALKKYCNEAMRGISKRYNCVTPRIHATWRRTVNERA